MKPIVDQLTLPVVIEGEVTHTSDEVLAAVREGQVNLERLLADTLTWREIRMRLVETLARIPSCVPIYDFVETHWPEHSPPRQAEVAAMEQRIGCLEREITRLKWRLENDR